MFHIHNGDSSADTAAQASLPGEHFAYREALITGPTPAGLSPSDWRQIRAQHLSASYDVSLERCTAELLDQTKKLETVREHDEVVLWFEHDLFCQVHLIHLLGLLSKQHPMPKKLSLICVGTFPGKPKFRGLGELDSAELASLFPARQPVSAEQLQLATVAWQAYCSSDPTAIEKLLDGNTGTLPFLGTALRAHLRRFPSTTNGLGEIETAALRLVREGASNFADLFSRFCNTHPVYGLGDAQLWLALYRLTGGRRPLLRLKSDNTAQRPSPVVPDAQFELTDAGASVLEGSMDNVELNGVDEWLGGVHLVGDVAHWRWDNSADRLVRLA